MQPTDALNLISNTLADRLDGSAVFEAPGNDILQVKFSIEGDYFRADFLRSDNTQLTITPGSVVALFSNGAIQVAPANTTAAITAWKQQPFITFAPVAAGLSQMNTGVPAIDGLISALAIQNGTLAIGVIPDLCWDQAQYATITLPGLVLTNVSGRICLRDIMIDTTTISFEVDLDAGADSCVLTLSPTRTVSLARTPATGVTLNLQVSVVLNLSEGRVNGDLIHLGMTAPSGSVFFDGDLANGFAASAEAIHLEFQDQIPTRGFVRAGLQPTPPGSQIVVTFAAGKQITTNNTTFSSFLGASFGLLRLTVEFQGQSLNPRAKLELHNGQASLSTLGVRFPGQTGLPDQFYNFQAPIGAPFVLEVDRLAYDLAEDGTTAIAIAACFSSPPNLTPNPPFKLGFSGGYQIELDTIGQVKLNGWNVGESDWRLGAAITGAAGSLTGPGLQGGSPLNLALTGFGLRLISDEYAPCNSSMLVARRHAFGDFQLVISHFPKHLADGNWGGIQIPISPDAIDQYLSGLAGQISSGVLKAIVQGILGIIGQASLIGGFVGLDVYLTVAGSYSVDLDPANCGPGRLRFVVQVDVDLGLIIKVYGQLGICPFCVRVLIATITRTVGHLNFTFNVDLFWRFDPGLDQVEITDVQVAGTGIIDDVGNAIMQIYKSKIVGQSISLPPEFQVRSLTVNFPGPADPDVTIAVVVGIEKLDWA
jgi:hypothetical protein